jgi:NitT/TauT family transport system ATP-binding protein
VFQEFALFPWKTVLGNVTYGLERRRRAELLRDRRFQDHVVAIEQLMEDPARDGGR